MSPQKASVAAAAAGLISALLFMSHTLGSVGALVLVYLTMLPLFLAGLGLGVAGALISAIVAGLVVGLAAGGLAFIGFVATNAVPVVIAVRLALLSHAGPDGTQEWFPLGRLLQYIIGYGLLLFALALVLASGSDGGLLGLLEGLLAREFADFLAIVGAEATVPAAGMLALATPGLVLASWLLMLVINAALAQGVLTRFGAALRPNLRLADVTLPDWLPLALAGAALVAVLATGTTRLVAVTVACALCAACFFAGLGIVHAWLHGRSGRTLLLALLYGTIVMLGWPIVIVAGLGLADHWTGWRRRMAAQASDREDE